MAIQFECSCGRKLSVKEESAGKRGRCPACGEILVVPQPAPAAPVEEDIYDFAAPIAPPPAPVAKLTPPPPMAARRHVPPQVTAPPPKNFVPDPAPGSQRRFLYFVLALALIPLTISTFDRKSGGDDEISMRLKQTFDAHSDVKSQIDGMDNPTYADVIQLLPNHRLEGALLPIDTWLHWLIALVDAGVFFGLVLIIFPGAIQNPLKLAAIGLFTATGGILLLLGFQFLADWTQGVWVRGTGWLTLLFYIVKFIGYSYRAALDPDSNLILSCIGFTCGVGLCEEFCKAIPVLTHYSGFNANWKWRTACACGLASGFGFGISEAIHYSGSSYNGLLGPEIYWVRFLSCVVLHGLWTGGGAISIFKRRQLLESGQGAFQWFAHAVMLLLVPIILHGMYDTLLKKDYNAGALIVAVATFAWFCFEVETARKRFDEPAARMRGAVA